MGSGSRSVRAQDGGTWALMGLGAVLGARSPPGDDGRAGSLWGSGHAEGDFSGKRVGAGVGRAEGGGEKKNLKGHSQTHSFADCQYMFSHLNGRMKYLWQIASISQSLKYLLSGAYQKCLLAPA